MKEELAAAVHEYQDLAARILGPGLIHHGTLVHRYANPMLGTTSRAPLYRRSSKVNGETTIRILTEGHAERYNEWIDNDRELRTIFKARLIDEAKDDPSKLPVK